MIRFIAAIDEKRGIADDKGIPWDLPTDRKYFRDQTKTGLVLMGYGTYIEFDKPMHHVPNYVASSVDRQLMPGFELVKDVPAFYKQHEGETINNIGGAGVFTSTLEYADELVLTLIHADFHCTKFFPPYEELFELISKEEPITENGITFHYENWKRKK